MFGTWAANIKEDLENKMGKTHFRTTRIMKKKKEHTKSVFDVV